MHPSFKQQMRRTIRFAIRTALDRLLLPLGRKWDLKVLPLDIQIQVLQGAPILKQIMLHKYV